jgi:hypothetical protein
MDFQDLLLFHPILFIDSLLRDIISRFAQWNNVTHINTFVYNNNNNSIFLRERQTFSIDFSTLSCWWTSFIRSFVHSFTQFIHHHKLFMFVACNDKLELDLTFRIYSIIVISIFCVIILFFITFTKNKQKLHLLLNFSQSLSHYSEREKNT